VALDGPPAPYATRAFTSCSLNFEDVILHRVFGATPHGFYVDVGAGHPRFENDTCALHEAGWSGINVEPNEDFIAAFRAARPHDRNLCLALADTEGELVFHEIPGTGLSTCDAAQAAAHAARGHEVVARRVPVSTLARVLDEAGSPDVDLLKVDVEGLEEVLAGNDWARFRPRVIVVEATFPESPARRPTNIGTFLDARGYRHALFDGLNDFYVHRDFKVPDGAFDLPPNVFDGFILREIADLRAATAALHAEFASAQAYAASLENARASDTAAFAAQRSELADALRAAQDRIGPLADANRTLLAEAEARGAALAAEVARSAALGRRARAGDARMAKIEALLTAVMRGADPSALRIVAADGTPLLLGPASGRGRGMDLSQGEARATGSEDGGAEEGMGAEDATLAARLAAAQIETLRAKTCQLGLDLDDLREENRRLRAAAGQMRAEILALSRALEPMHRLGDELERHRAQAGSLARSVGERDVELGALRAALEQLRAAEAGERARSEALARQLNAVHRSSSWLLTRPWRGVGRLLRRGG
jgi:FkbM family methyltransferase